MNKQNFIFKIFSISMLVVNVAFVVFFVSAIVNVLNKSCIFGAVHIIILSLVFVLNILYLIYTIFVLAINIFIKKQKIKNQ